MINTKKLDLGTFVYKSENIHGVEVQSFLGIPYAKAERFGMPTVIELDSFYKKRKNSRT